MKRLLINIAGFQIGWFGCILSARWDMPLVGIAIVAAVIAAHLWMRSWDRREALAIGAIFASGAAMDSILLGFGLLSFQESSTVTPLFALWIGAMWANFGATLNTSYRWLRGRWALAAAFGLVGGPTTYYAGMKLGAIGFHESQHWTWLALGIEWTIAMPLALWAAARLTGWRPAKLTGSPPASPEGDVA
ncbi:MAG: DUF2878 domain-containing protein [Phycisphaeraceae bacterium]|nr:MAG: DUF2878 domain-containing protein [Phycisphaeraceae bacterium]